MAQPAVVVAAQTGGDAELAKADGILNIGGLLFDIGSAAKIEEPPATSQIKGQKPGLETRIRQKSRSRALSRIAHPGSDDRRARSRRAQGIEQGIREPGLKVLR